MPAIYQRWYRFVLLTGTSLDQGQNFETLRGTDEHGKAFLHGLAEYIIDRGLEHFFPLTEPSKLLKTLLQVYKDEAIDNMNISEVLAKIEQKIKQNRRF